MADLNEIHLMLGRLIEGQENMERGITGLNQRIDDKIQPILDDYTNNKHRTIGAVGVISALIGGSFAWIAELFKH